MSSTTTHFSIPTDANGVKTTPEAKPPAAQNALDHSVSDSILFARLISVALAAVTLNSYFF